MTVWLCRVIPWSAGGFIPYLTRAAAGRRLTSSQAILCVASERLMGRDEFRLSLICNYWMELLDAVQPNYMVSILLENSLIQYAESIAKHGSYWFVQDHVALTEYVDDYRRIVIERRVEQGDKKYLGLESANCSDIAYQFMLSLIEDNYGLRDKCKARIDGLYSSYGKRFVKYLGNVENLFDIWLSAKKRDLSNQQPRVQSWKY